MRAYACVPYSTSRGIRFFIFIQRPDHVAISRAEAAGELYVRMASVDNAAPCPCVRVCVCVCVCRSQYEIQSEFLKMHPDPIPRRRKANAKDGKKMKKAKKAKDPNAPKRPLSAYLLFMNDFREEYMVRGANLCVCVCPYIPHLNGGGERRIADAD